MAPTEIIIPLLGAGVAALSSLVKNWLARKSESAITINLGNGSKITVDGSEDSREKVRRVLSETFGPSVPDLSDRSTLKNDPAAKNVEQREDK